MRIAAFVLSLLLSSSVPAYAQGYLGQRSTNPYAPNSLSNPYSAGRSYNQNRFLGDRKASVGLLREDLWRPFRQSTNKYNLNSITNPYRQYGSPYSPNSNNNSNGAGSRYSSDSPFKPYRKGLRVDGE